MIILFYAWLLAFTALGGESLVAFADVVLSAWLFCVWLSLFNKEFIESRATKCESKTRLTLISLTRMAFGLAFAYFDAPVLGALLFITEYFYFALVRCKIDS